MFNFIEVPSGVLDVNVIYLRCPLASNVNCVKILGGTAELFRPFQKDDFFYDLKTYDL